MICAPIELVSWLSLPRVDVHSKSREEHSLDFGTSSIKAQRNE
jgi:hypothetical protein